MPVAASAAVLGVWGAVAHDSGAGWAQAVGALVAAGLIVGMLAPGVGVVRTRCRVVAVPREVTAGAVVVLEVTSAAPVEIQPLDPPGPAVMVPGRRRATLEVRPAHRGVLRHCTVAVASAWPFGVLWWTRTETLTLPRPLIVAPRVGAEEADARSARAADESPLWGPSRGAEPRGVRPYEPGDRPALVHWRATAHTGSLMVREAQRPGPHAAVVDGRLPADPDAAERHAERVMATVRALLLAGAHVDLRTIEEDGDVVAPVATLGAAGQRLARALPLAGPPWAGRQVADDPSHPVRPRDGRS